MSRDLRINPLTTQPASSYIPIQVQGLSLAAGASSILVAADSTKARAVSHVYITAAGTPQFRLRWTDTTLIFNSGLAGTIPCPELWTPSYKRGAGNGIEIVNPSAGGPFVFYGTIYYLEETDP